MNQLHIKETFTTIRALMEPPPGIAKRRISYWPLLGRISSESSRTLQGHRGWRNPRELEGYPLAFLIEKG